MSARYFEAFGHSKLYAQFRPNAPTHLIKMLVDSVKKKFGSNLNMAVDIGCGTGQSTRGLAQYFSNVAGVDVSESQIYEANKANTLKNVKYMVSPAEKLPFDSNSVQLVTVSQACHWLDMPKFFKESDRILSPGGVLAMYIYSLPRLTWGDKSEKLFQIVDDFYINQTAKYFGKERKYIDDELTDPKFIIPYSDYRREENFSYEKTVTVREFQGYVSSWSGFQGYMKANGEDAAIKILEQLISEIMETLEVTTTAEETKLVMRFKYILLFGSKPL